MAADGQTQGLFGYFTRHRTAANLVLLLMVVAGLAAWPRMRAQYFPDVIVDSISVSVAWEGAGAEDVDAAIVQLLGPALQTVAGVSATSATAREGQAQIRLEFEPGTDMDRAEREVQEAANGIGNLPETAEEPTVRRSGWSERVVQVVITGPVDVASLGRYADEMVQRLFEEGVTSTSVQGVAAPSILVEVPSLALIRHDVGLSEVADTIAREVSADPAGDSGAARIRTGEARRSTEEIEAIVLRQNPDGSELTIGDIAAVISEGPDRERAYFVGPDPAVTVQVNRSAEGDAIGIEETVQEVARELEATLPQGTTMTLTNSTAEQITARLALLIDNGVTGLALVVLLLFLFLNARTALWVAAGIPISMLAAIAVMYAAGLTLNMMSLFALILTLGIVVDDAIVVGEHADFRVRRLGEPPAVGASNAARRMFPPVFAATLTTIIAFFGLVTIGGRFGDLISDIPFTVIAVLAASLVECFLILPNHMSHSVTAQTRWYDLPSQMVNRGFAWFQRVLFRPFVAGVVWARYPVLAFALVLLAWQSALVIRGDVQWRFFSSPEQASLSGNFAMLPAATRDDTLEMMRELQRATEDLATEYEAEFGVNPLRSVIAEIGGNSGRGLSGADTKESWQLGAITIELVNADLRPYTSAEFTAALQERVQMHPLAETVSFRSFGTGPGGDAIDVDLYGAEPETLKAAAEALKAELARIPEVTGPEDSLAYDKEELILQLTPQGRALGVTIDALGRELRQRLGGIEAATYPSGTRSATIRVELPEAELTADFLDRTMLRTSEGVYVPLADIVTVERRTGFSTVSRENGTAVISVTAGLADEDPDRAAEVMRSLETEILPKIAADHGVGTAMSGLSEQESAFLDDAFTGLIFCLTGIYLTLAWIFASWTRPLIVMAVIPFGAVGAIWGHDLWGIPMSMFTVIGLIGMVGIIINDSIVLVTTIDEYGQSRGLGSAIIDGTADRLRPVFLTTATTVIGLAPLLYEGSNDAEFLKPTVITLVYGLGFGMVLVLCVVPALLAIQADIARQVRAARRSLRAGPRAVALPVRLGMLSAVGLFAALILPVALTGAAWPDLAQAWPILAGGMPVAFGLFVIGLALVLVLIFAGAVLTTSRGRRRGA